LEFNVPFQHKHGYIRDDVQYSVGLRVVSQSETVRWDAISHVIMNALWFMLIKISI